MEIIGAIIFIYITLSSFGLLSSLMLEMSIDDYTSSDEFKGRSPNMPMIPIFEIVRIDWIKLNILKLLYGSFILVISNVLLILMIFPIIDSILWLFQIEYRTSKRVGKFLYNKLFKNE